MTDIDDLGHSTDPDHIEVPLRHTGKVDMAMMVETDGTITLQTQGSPTEWIEAEQGSHVGVKDSEHLDTRLEGLE